MQFTIHNLQFTKNKQDLQNGQSLFELVVAIAISALVIVAIVSLTTNSIQNSSYSKNKTLAATYAQEATEWLRGQRDADINLFVIHSTTPSWCLQQLEFTQPTADPASLCLGKISGTVFRRWVNFNVNVQGGKNVIEADVVVYWVDSQGSHEVKSVTNYADWRER